MKMEYSESRAIELMKTAKRVAVKGTEYVNQMTLIRSLSTISETERYFVLNHIQNKITKCKKLVDAISNAMINRI